MNTLKITFLMSLLTVLLVVMGGALGGGGGAALAFIIAAGMNFFSYWFSDKMVLSMYGAREITPSEDPRFYGIVQRLAFGQLLPNVMPVLGRVRNLLPHGRYNVAVGVFDPLFSLIPSPVMAVPKLPFSDAGKERE